MRALSSSIAVKAPGSFALAYMNTYFLERGPQGAAKIALRFPFPERIIAGLTIEKTVSLKLAYGALDTSAKNVAFGWQPVGTRVLPAFSGTLSAISRSEDSCRLSIDGGYVAPGGVPGKIFDSLIGVHIARVTLTTLLATFAHDIEADYATRVNS